MENGSPITTDLLKKSVSLAKEFGSFFLDEIKETAIQKLPMLFQVSYVGIFLYEMENDALVLLQQNREISSVFKIPTRVPNNLFSYALQQNNILYFKSIGEYEKSQGKTYVITPFHKYLNNFCMLVPLAIGTGEKKELVGLLVLADRRNNLSFSEIEFYTASYLGDVISYSINRSRSIQADKPSIIVDNLTNLFQWQIFYENFSREVYRAARYNLALSLMLLDLDKFRLNSEGITSFLTDEALRDSADLIHQTVRNVDIASRQNNRFYILLPETKVNDAMILAERLRKAFDEHHISPDSQNIPLTVSIGLVGYRSGYTPISFIKKGEIALARAQENGGNQIITYDIISGD